LQINSRFSYRHAQAILDVEFAAELGEVETVLTSVPWSPKRVRRTRGGKTYSFSIDQRATNAAIESAFSSLNTGWIKHPNIVSHSESRLVADFKKGKVQVEIQFGNMARWYTDVFKFLLSYAADDIEVGILAVPVQAAANRIDENVVYFERVIRELPHAKMAITIPILVVGLV
jgi:hypothetical protein